MTRLKCTLHGANNWAQHCRLLSHGGGGADPYPAATPVRFSCGAGQQLVAGLAAAAQSWWQRDSWWQARPLLEAGDSCRVGQRVTAGDSSRQLLSLW